MHKNDSMPVFDSKTRSPPLAESFLKSRWFCVVKITMMDQHDFLTLTGLERERQSTLNRFWPSSRKRSVLAESDRFEYPADCAEP